MSAVGLILCGLLLAMYLIYPAPFHRAARWVVNAPFAALSDAQDRAVPGPYGTNRPSAKRQNTARPVPVPKKKPPKKQQPARGKTK